MSSYEPVKRARTVVFAVTSVVLVEFVAMAADGTADGASEAGSVVGVAVGMAVGAA
jgi:hypothetical protein